MLVQPTVVELSAYVFAQTPDKSAARCCAFRPRRRPLVLVALCHCLDSRNASAVPLAFPRFSRASTWRRNGSLGDIAIALPSLSAVRVDRILGAGGQTRCDRGGRGFVRRSLVPSIIVNSLLALACNGNLLAPTRLRLEKDQNRWSASHAA